MTGHKKNKFFYDIKANLIKLVSELQIEWRFKKRGIN